MANLKKGGYNYEVSPFNFLGATFRFKEMQGSKSKE